MNIGDLVTRRDKGKNTPEQTGSPTASQITVSREFAVIGLGRFGVSLAETLIERGFHVLGIDRDTHLVDYYADDLTQTVALDATDEHALAEIDIASFDTVVVAIGEHLEESVMTTAILKELGVRQIVCKAASKRQRDILYRVGATRVIQPEYDAGKHLGQQLAKPNVIEQIVLGPVQRCSLVQMTTAYFGHTLQELNFEEKFGVKVLGVVRDDNTEIDPHINHIVREGDQLIVFGHRNDIAKLARG